MKSVWVFYDNNMEIEVYATKEKMVKEIQEYFDRRIENLIEDGLQDTLEYISVVKGQKYFIEKIKNDPPNIFFWNEYDHYDVSNTVVTPTVELINVQK